MKNFGFRRKCGILMHISSLPSPFGIGTLGKHAHRFVDFLRETGQKCWQVLPLNPTSYGDSPYQSPASMAGNPYFIDPELLFEEGLLTKEELDSARFDGSRVDYGWLFTTRYPLLRAAHERFKPTPAFRAFCRANRDWLSDYALFMSLKVHYGYAPFTAWEKEHRTYALAKESAAAFGAEMNFWRWVQFAFFSQWRALRDYAHNNGILLIGDMPIYVAHDSMDVWRAPEEFMLDENLCPTLVAGCPPDAYAADGQLWGNPIYRWDKMEKEGFSFWISRMKAAFRLFDILRIDHFRGFASYYCIPATDKTAANGHWETAPGKALFDTVAAALPRARIIAEDLGFITPDVRELLRTTGFPGMKVLQFAFYTPESEYLPRTYETDNCVVYSASHDSDCTATWLRTLTGDARARFNRECPRNKSANRTRTEDVIALAMGSRANLCVVPMQDYLGLTNEKGRMNTPSKAEGNWQWRISPRFATKALTKRILSLVREYNR